MDRLERIRLEVMTESTLNNLERLDELKLWLISNGFSPISFLMAYELEMKRLENESPSGFKDHKINRSVSN